MRAATLLMASFVCGLFVSPAFAHHCSGHHHNGDCGDCNSNYSARGGPQAQQNSKPGSTTVELQAVEGKVSEIIYLPGVTSDSGLVEARVFSAGSSTLVRLAPVGLLKQRQLVLREGDSVSITGYIVNGMEGDLLVATDIRKGDRHVTLRDSRGRLTQ